MEPVNMSASPDNHAEYSWKGNDVSQEELMEVDTVLVLDPLDTVVGAASKKDSHVFSPSQPYGVLHRAFSVFAVDTATNKLLLQQRASSKITFPNVGLVEAPFTVTTQLYSILPTSFPLTSFCFYRALPLAR
jgi:hypothetical protein